MMIGLITSPGWATWGYKWSEGQKRCNSRLLNLILIEDPRRGPQMNGGMQVVGQRVDSSVGS
ncbi:hypothetical protein ACVWWN_001463 [Mycobacterium sp. URHB0021]